MPQPTIIKGLSRRAALTMIEHFQIRLAESFMLTPSVRQVNVTH